MQEDTFINISYGTQILDFEVVRKGIFQKRRELFKAGYDFHWSGNDLELPSTEQQFRARGFNLIGDFIQASFNQKYGDLAFLISIDLREKTARIFGEQQIPQSHYNQARLDLNKLEQITEINFELEKV